MKDHAETEEWVQIVDRVDALLLSDVSDELRADLPRTAMAYSAIQRFTR